jgi:CRISPR/Cas system CSM-associated protein Csm4 (group 5 of RAMP superfamily)
MISMKNKQIKRIVFASLIALCFFSCNSHEQEIKQKVKTLTNNNIKMPKDSILQKEQNKILVLIKDTGDCSACNMHVNNWYIYSLDMEDRDLQPTSITFVLPKDIRLSSNVDSMINLYGLHKTHTYEELIKLNPILEKVKYSTFLLSPKNQIILVGDPIETPKMWNLYRKALKK